MAGADSAKAEFENNSRPTAICTTFAVMNARIICVTVINSKLLGTSTYGGDCDCRESCLSGWTSVWLSLASNTQKVAIDKKIYPVKFEPNWVRVI